MFKQLTFAMAAVLALAGAAALSTEASAQAFTHATPPGQWGANNQPNPAPDGGPGAARADRNCFQFGNRLVCQDEPRRTWWREGDHRCCHRHVRKVRVRYHGKIMFKYVYGKPHCHSGKLFLKHCVMGRY